MAETASTLPPASVGECIIQGITSDHRPFRPSDWAERLCGAMSCFRPQGYAGRNAHLVYSPYVQPTVIDGVKCVVVDEALRALQPLAWHFVMDFARDNDLQVLDACILPDPGITAGVVERGASPENAMHDTQDLPAPLPSGSPAGSPAVSLPSAVVRTERDSFGPIDVDARRLWGAQTERSLAHFHISTERMPFELILALAEVKRACAVVNRDLGQLDGERAGAIITAADEVIAGLHPDEFPLAVWQTGSGTQTNMNMNEVLANRGSELLGGPRGESRKIHPNDHVNLGQSSNDIFPTAMHVAAVRGMDERLIPALRALESTLHRKACAFDHVVKIGRTHLQDATPMTLGQEFSGYVAQLAHAQALVAMLVLPLHELAVGGTAVGTGMNTHPEFGERVAAELAHRCHMPFCSAANKFAALAAHDALVAAHGGLKTLAVAMMKIANDIRWLASGPRSGLGEIRIPENEPGSSIMPGKVNPTQCEAMTMLCCQVFGNDAAITVAGASGNFELNVFKPLIAHAFLQSVRLLADGIDSFDRHCAQGIEADETRIADLMRRSLMLVTALAPYIGYDSAAKIAKEAHRTGGTLEETAVALGLVSAEDFARWVQPEAMTRPGE